MTALEKATRAVAEYFGEYDAMLANKREWVDRRGLDHTNTPVDVSGPFRDDLTDIARAVLMAVREPGMDAGLAGAEQVNIQMRGATKADYCAAQDSFTAMIDAILNQNP